MYLCICITTDTHLVPVRPDSNVWYKHVCVCVCVCVCVSLIMSREEIHFLITDGTICENL